MRRLGLSLVILGLLASSLAGCQSNQAPPPLPSAFTALSALCREPGGFALRTSLLLSEARYQDNFVFWIGPQGLKATSQGPFPRARWTRIDQNHTVYSDASYEGLVDLKSWPDFMHSLISECAGGFPNTSVRPTRPPAIGHRGRHLDWYSVSLPARELQHLDIYLGLTPGGATIHSVLLDPLCGPAVLARMSDGSWDYPGAWTAGSLPLPDSPQVSAELESSAYNTRSGLIPIPPLPAADSRAPLPTEASRRGDLSAAEERARGYFEPWSTNGCRPRAKANRVFYVAEADSHAE